MMTSSKKIIAITGTQGSGKDTMAEFLEQKYGYKHYSLSDIVRDETGKRGLEQNRDNWREVADALREKYGNEAIAILMIEKIKNEDNNVVIITSFRHPNEVDLIKGSYPDFTLISLDAPIETRYERVMGRGNLADRIDFEHYKKQEELENVKIKTGMRIREVMAIKDYEIINDGGKEEFIEKIEKLHNKIINES